MAAAVNLSVAEIEALAERALSKAGASKNSATSLAKGIAAAERDGLSSHGLAYLATYCEHLTIGKVVGSAEPKLEKTAGSILTVDAGAGFAHPAIDIGFAALVPLARSQGIAGLAIRNSYNCGVLAYHTERLAAQGLVAIGFTNAPASIAPSGGIKPVFGTNPWSLAAPDGKGGVAFVIDQSASVIAKSEVMKKARLGEPIPAGWALGPDGQATTDPNIGLKGSMAPSGGYKGVGIALFVETMAACLPGATLGIHASPFSGPAGGPPRTGQFFIAISPDATSAGAFAARIGDLLGAYAAQPGAQLPGSRRKTARPRADREGVKVDAAIVEKARALTG